MGQFFAIRCSHYSAKKPQILVRKSKMVTLRGVNRKFGRWTVYDTFIALQINFQASCRNWLKIDILAFLKMATFQTLEIALNLKI